nr:putative ribonuclease H-like domain, reverse transcriptase zinc-binding domain-containing protein [Ipomoea batatas]
MPTNGNRWILSERPARTPPPATTPPGDNQHVHPQSGIPRYEVTDSQSTVPASLYTVGNDQHAVPQANFNATATLEESSFNAGAVASDTPSLSQSGISALGLLIHDRRRRRSYEELGPFLNGPDHVAAMFCGLCSNAVETTSHVLIYCDVAMSCWNNFENIYMENDLDITVWLERNMEKLSTEAFGLLLTTCWMIWQERNNRVWNNAQATSPRLLDHAASFLETWRSLQSSTRAPTAVIYPTAWQAPPSGYLKVNVDAANDIVSKVTGVASLIRDSAGSFHAALQLKLNGYHDMISKEHTLLEGDVAAPRAQRRLQSQESALHTLGSIPQPVS